MIKLMNILPERYSHPICPRKQGESDEAYKLRCSPIISPSILLNVSSTNEETKNFNRVKYYEEYYKNLTPSEFEVSSEGNTIKIVISE